MNLQDFEQFLNAEDWIKSQPCQIKEDLIDEELTLENSINNLKNDDISHQTLGVNDKTELLTNLNSSHQQSDTCQHYHKSYQNIPSTLYDGSSPLSPFPHNALNSFQTPTLLNAMITPPDVFPMISPQQNSMDYNKNKEKNLDLTNIYPYELNDSPTKSWQTVQHQNQYSSDIHSNKSFDNYKNSCNSPSKKIRDMTDSPNFMMPSPMLPTAGDVCQHHYCHPKSYDVHSNTNVSAIYH